MLSWFRRDPMRRQGRAIGDLAVATDSLIPDWTILKLERRSDGIITLTTTSPTGVVVWTLSKT